MTDRLIAHDDDIVSAGNQLTFDPYNAANKEISLEQIQTILTKYGVPCRVYNLALYKRAFVHRSYCKRPYLEENKSVKSAVRPADCLELFSKSNERLEFLGDGILECITKYYIYRRFPKENEGFMTEKKISLVKNEAIGKMAYELGLHEFYLLSKHAEAKKTRTNLKKLGCLFEAFLGALFLDMNKIEIHDEERWFESFLTGPGFQAAQVFVERAFEAHIDWTAIINTDDNYKNILQVKLQREFKTTPDYLELAHNEHGYHMGVFLCLGQSIHTVDPVNAVPIQSFGCLDKIHGFKGLVFLGKGVHKIKKKAEQLACESVLRFL
jgi:dsRNA-specific ribonuclease